MLIQDIRNIVLEYADIKNDNGEFLNYCNLCKTYKKEKMICLDLIFYQIKLSFILDSFFNESIKEISFEKIISKSSILPEDGKIHRYGWVTNSLYIEDYWYSLHNMRSIDDLIMLRLDYVEFLNKNFLLLEERCMNICKSCKEQDRKIKID